MPLLICFGLLGPFQTMIVCPEIKQKHPQDRKTIFETLSLPVAKVLPPVLGTEKVHQRTCATKILLNFRVSFLVRFASKPLFDWVVP